MADCTRKDLTELLHAYELGLLSEERRTELEQHALVCDHCFAEMERISDAARLLNFDTDTREQVREITRQASEPASSQAEPRRSWQMLVPAAILVGIVLLLVLKDWRVEISPTESVMAGENRVAVLPFDNLVQSSESSRLGEVIASLLITDLSQSSSLQIVSSQYLHDLSRGTTTASSEGANGQAIRLAKRAGAAWLLTGAVTQVSPQVVMTAQLVEVSTGAVKTAARTSSPDDTTIFAAVDRLSDSIRVALLNAVDAGRGTKRPIAEITTESIKAYQEYIRGLDLYWKYYYNDAEPHFRRAIALDSTFAIPYYYLSLISPASEGRALMGVAVKHLGHAGERESYLIRSRAAALAGRGQESIELLRAFVQRYPDEKEPHYQLALGEYSVRRFLDAVKRCQDAIALDSTYGQAYNQLAYTYDRLGDLDNAIRSINMYIAVSPGQANPYDSRAEIFARNGKVDQAIASYREALRIKPDLYSSLSNLGMMYLFQEDYVRAESCFAASAQTINKRNRASARLGLCYLPAYRGHFRETLSAIDSAIHADSADGIAGYVATMLWFRAFIYEAMGSLDSARQILTVGFSLDSSTDMGNRLAYGVRLAAQSGDLREARALIDRLRKIPRDSGVIYAPLLAAEAAIAEASSLSDSAIILYEQAATQTESFIDRLRLAQSYLNNRQSTKAVPILENLSLSYTPFRQFWLPEGVKLAYYLGRAYEDCRWTEKAIAQYRAFTTTWQTANPVVRELADARERLGRLERQP